jgi:hypothetical protein
MPAEPSSPCSSSSLFFDVPNGPEGGTQLYWQLIRYSWLITYLAMLRSDDNVSRKTDSEKRELLPSSFPVIQKNAEELVFGGVNLLATVALLDVGKMAMAL